MRRTLAVSLALALPTLALAEDKIDTSGAANKLEAFRKDIKKGSNETAADVKANTAKNTKKTDTKAAKPAPKK